MIYETAVDKFNEFRNFMGRDTKAVEIGVYTLFAVAYLKVRPITKFRQASDIPKHFIRNKVKQYGKVQFIEPTITSGPLMHINHKPPINIFFASKKTLPVKVLGVSINSNGYSWLNSVAVNHKVEFIPLAVHENAAECHVVIKTTSKYQPNIDVGAALVSLGFATVTSPPVGLTDKLTAQYFKFLKHKEETARKSRNGVWTLTEPQPTWPVKVMNALMDKAYYAVLPANRRLPALVR